jgi:hypothetical protein
VNLTKTIEMDNNNAVSVHRFPAWMMLAVFSGICSLAWQSRRGIFDVNKTDEVWLWIVTLTSLGLGLCGVLSYLVARTVVVGKVPEMILAVLVLALWAAGLPFIMNPSNNIAVARPTTTSVAPVVINVNLYFFAWLSLAVAIYLVISLGQEWYNKRSNHPNIQSGQHSKWPYHSGGGRSGQGVAMVWYGRRFARGIGCVGRHLSIGLLPHRHRRRPGWQQ